MRQIACNKFNVQQFFDWTTKGEQSGGVFFHFFSLLELKHSQKRHIACVNYSLSTINCYWSVTYSELITFFCHLKMLYSMPYPCHVVNTRLIKAIVCALCVLIKLEKLCRILAQARQQHGMNKQKSGTCSFPLKSNHLRIIDALYRHQKAQNHNHNIYIFIRPGHFRDGSSIDLIIIVHVTFIWKLTAV